MICSCFLRAHTLSGEAKTDVFAHYFTFVGINVFVNITERLADTSNLPDRKRTISDIYITQEITDRQERLTE